MKKTLSVNAIENGIVIDHIPAGQAVRIISLLGLANHKSQMTIGLNLQSKSSGLKDLIKMEGHTLSDKEQHQLAIFAPNASINFIENFQVVKKVKATAPQEVAGILECPNPICITNIDPVDSFFYLREMLGEFKLHCKYCEKNFDRDEVKEVAA